MQSKPNWASVFPSQLAVIKVKTWTLNLHLSTLWSCRTITVVLAKISHSAQTDHWFTDWSLEGVFQTVLSLSVSFVSQPKLILGESQHHGVVRGQKSRLLLLPRLSIICTLAWGAISQTNTSKQRNFFCHLCIPLSPVKWSTCLAQEPMHDGGVIW